MSLSQTGAELMKIAQMGPKYPDIAIKRLDEVYHNYGALNVEKWRNMSNKKNTLLHELVESKMIDVIRHAVTERKFPVNTKRDTDGWTALQLASDKQYTKICEVLEELGAETIETVDVSAWSPEADKEKSLNMVWVDLEMTSIEDPKILECAVIITDKDLHTLGRDEWVVHFEKEELDSLGEWHQEHFQDRAKGGNNLFKDCIKSKFTNDEVEDRLLKLIKMHCPEGKCSLAGSSIHTDKSVLQKCMPRVHAYLHYRIIDVSSIQAVMRRWAPSVEQRIKSRLARNGQESVSHRAMDDIEWSISFMKEFREMMIKVTSHSDARQHGGSNFNNRGSSNFNNRGSSNLNHRGSSQLHHHVSPHENHRGGARSIVENRHSLQDPIDSENISMLNPRIDATSLYKDEQQLVSRIKIDHKFRDQTLGLPDKDLEIYCENPHLREIFLNRQQIKPYSGIEFTKENRQLTVIPHESSAECESPASTKYCTTEHWGERKLLLTEIEFLIKCHSNNSVLAVYAGAAPGCHIPILSDLFPTVQFALFDDKPFVIKSTDRITIYPERLTKASAKTVRDKAQRSVVFICNVRTQPQPNDRQNDPMEDMTNQLSLHDALKSEMSLLNFRAPRELKKFKYADGILIIEPWSSRKTTECRLIIEKDPKSIEYNSQDIQNSMNYFQNVTRTLYYPHDMDTIENDGLDHCYDCRSEIYILGKYLTRIQHVKTDQELNKAVAHLSTRISGKIADKSRPSFLKEERTLGIIPKKYLSTKV